MKIICFKPKLYKNWKNGHSSEQVWNVMNTHWGIVSDDFYEQIQTFQDLFSKGKIYLTEIDAYLQTQIRIGYTLTDEDMNYIKSLHKEDIDTWDKLRENYGGFSNTICEFLAKKPFVNKFIRCACRMGQNDVQTISLKWWLSVQWLQIKKVYLNLKLKQYYKVHPIVNYHEE
jgi:hypothetical protein